MCSHVVVSAYGVFVLTVKTEAGKVTGREGDREWHIKSARDILYNPLWENRKHVNALEKIIGPVWFIPVVVFTRAGLKGDFGSYVVSLKELMPYIKKHKKFRLSDDKQDEIVRKNQVYFQLLNMIRLSRDVYIISYARRC